MRVKTGPWAVPAQSTARADRHMTPNRLKQKLQNGAKTLNAWCVLASPHVAEILASLSFDSLTIDIQHGAMDGADTFQMLQAVASSPVTPLVRVPWNEPAGMMKALDAGAQGIICPMINTAQEAQAFVAACRYPPGGTRSFGPTRAALATKAASSAAYATEANDHVLCFAMIETRLGLDNLDDILSVDGLDGIYVGPGDLSLALGATPSMQPPAGPVADAIVRCATRAKAHRRFAAVHTDGPQTARRRFAEGFGLCTLQSDARLIADGANMQLAEATLS